MTVLTIESVFAALSESEVILPRIKHGISVFSVFFMILDISVFGKTVKMILVWEPVLTKMSEISIILVNFRVFG